MAYASKAGHARTSARNPQAHAFCDRCGGRYNHVDLSWQMDWAGASIINKRILVCRTCMDLPQTQLRSIVLPADPVPIMNPRPGNNEKYATTFRSLSGSGTVDFWTGIPVPDDNLRETQGGELRVTEGNGTFGADPIQPVIPTNIIAASISPAGTLTVSYTGPYQELSINSDGELQLRYTGPFAGPEVSGMVDASGNLILEI